MGCRERVHNELFDALGAEVYAAESRRPGGDPTLQVLFLGERFAAGGPPLVAWESVLGRLSEIALVQARQGNADGIRAVYALKRWAAKREREREAIDELPSRRTGPRAAGDVGDDKSSRQSEHSADVPAP